MSKLTDFEERLKEESKGYKQVRSMIPLAISLTREIWGDSEDEVEKLKAEMEEYRDLWAKAQLAEGVYSGLKRLYNEQGSELVSLKKQLAQAQGKGLSRQQIIDILHDKFVIDDEHDFKCLDCHLCGGGVIEIASTLLQAGGIGAKEMGVMDITQIIVRHTCENHWYPSSDNACIKLAQALHSVLYGKGEVVYPSFCNDCGAVLQKEGCIICKEKPQEKYCQCGHFTNVSPGMAIAVDKLAPLTCAKCHKEIKLSKSQEKVGKVEPLYFTYPPTDEATLMCKDKINEVIKRLNDHLS